MGRNETYQTIKNMGFNPLVMVDCGAAWGEWCGTMKPLFPESFIIAVDANKWTPENIPGSDVTEIEVLSDVDDKEMTFFRKKENLDEGKFCTGDSLFKENTQHYQEHNTVESIVKTKTLKSLIEKHGKSKIDILKIDTQGSEILIMKGLGDTLKNVDFIELECSLVEYNLGGCNFYDIINFLKEDFEIFDIIDLHKHHGQYLCQIDVIFQNKNSMHKRQM
jgi:FkbM family methyltransferase